MPAIGSQRRLLQALMLSPAAQLRRFCSRILRWGLAKFAKAVSAQRFRRSLTDLADEKVSFFDVAILIFSPFAGLRPSRSGVALTLNFPKPGSDTSAPLATASKIFFMMSSTIDLACALLTPCVSASFATSSVTFIAGVPSDSRRLWHGPVGMSFSRDWPIHAASRGVTTTPAPIARGFALQ